MRPQRAVGHPISLVAGTATRRDAVGLAPIAPSGSPSIIVYALRFLANRTSLDTAVGVSLRPTGCGSPMDAVRGRPTTRASSGARGSLASSSLGARAAAVYASCPYLP